MPALVSRPMVVLSPHLDDAVLSCGGLLLRHSAAEVVTVFSADPPDARIAGLTALALPKERRSEDARAMSRLGCKSTLLGQVDALDRRNGDGTVRYSSRSALFGFVAPADASLCDDIVSAVARVLGDRLLLCPIGVGAHVDHQLCAHAARKLLSRGKSVLFYEDAPYVYADAGPVVQNDSVVRAVSRLRARVVGIEDVFIDVAAKSEVVACYQSQVTALFGDLDRYRRCVDSHLLSLGGSVERFYELRFA